MPSKKRADGEGSYSYDKEKDMWRYRVKIGEKTKTVDGKTVKVPIYKPFSATGKGAKAAAKAKYDVWKAEQEPGAVVTVSPSTKLGAWITLWLETCKKNAVTDDWYDELVRMKGMLPFELRDKKVSEVSNIELQRFLNEFSHTRSKSYADKMGTFLRSCFKKAHDNGICGTNPAAELKTPGKIEPPRKAFTPEQASLILEFAAVYRQDWKNARQKAYGLLMGVAVITMLTTGLRRGELLGLMWGDVGQGRLTVNRAVYMKRGEDSKRHPAVEDYRAKNKSSLRTIPLPQMVETAIAALPRRGMYVFESMDGGLMIPRNFNRGYDNFIRDLRKAYPQLPKLHPHECRHTFATLALDGGTNIKVLQLMLGHLKIETTARYLHPDFSAMQEASAGVLSAIRCTDRCTDKAEKAGISK